MQVAGSPADECMRASLLGDTFMSGRKPPILEMPRLTPPPPLSSHALILSAASCGLRPGRLVAAATLR